MAAIESRRPESMAKLKHDTRKPSVAEGLQAASPRIQQDTDMISHDKIKSDNRKLKPVAGDHENSDSDMPSPGKAKVKSDTRKRSVAGEIQAASPRLKQKLDMANKTSSDKAKLKQKSRKRSLADVTHDEEPETKQGKTQPEFKYISEVEFKFLLSDQETVMEGLEKFIGSAEAVLEEQPCPDIVAGYCRSSQTCSELFTLIDPSGPKMKANELALVFRCLELVLTRIQTDLLKFSSTGEAIVQKLLAGHMGQVYNCLQEQNKSKTIKAALRLLTSMVRLSDRAKKAVQSRLNFAHVTFPPIFRRRNRKDPNDVRSCAVALTLSFLQDSDLSTISSLVQQRTFLQQVIGGLKYDRRDLVLETLATLLDKVVTFPGLTKTDKVKLFSETVLKQLCELYDWQGPTGWVPGGKKRQKDDEPRVIPEGFSEDQEAVASVAHAFLLEVCCSHKHGLNFYDKSLGTGNRNYNQLLAHLVDWLVKKMDKPKIADLIIGILCACPDLMKATLTNLCPSLTPRWSDKWRQLMGWLIKLYRKLPDIPQFLSSLDYLKEDHITVVSMATKFCLPPTNVAAILTQGLKHEDIRVRDKCAHLVQVLAKKACAVQEKLSLDVTSNTTASLDDSSILDLFTVTVMKNLPAASQLFVCVDKTMQLMSAKQQTLDKLDTAVVDEAAVSVDLAQHASILLQVLGLYQTLVPSLLSDRPRDTARLVDMVGCLQSHHGQEHDDGGDENQQITNEQGWLPQLYLLKLLSDTDARKISLGREGLLEKLLLSASLSEKVRDLTKALICKMLESMEVFSGHATELHTWLEIAMTASGHRQTGKSSKPASPASSKPILFLARCLAALINNPLPYVDRIMEAVAETGRTDLSGDQDMDSVSIGTSESAIEAVLMMEDEELDSKLDNCPLLTSNPQVDVVHLPLSPLTVVAMDNLQFGKSGNVTETEYVSKVLVHLLHSLPVPDTLARIVIKSEAKLCDGVAAYLKYWTCGKKQKKSLTQPLPGEIFGKFTSALMSQHFGLKASNYPERLSKEIPRMSNQDRLIALRQVLLYIRDTLQTSQKTACVETITPYLGLASSLAQHIQEGSQENKSNTSSWIKTLTTPKDALDVDDDDSGCDVAVFDVLFSQFMASSSESLVAAGCKCVLLDPQLKSWLFKSVCDVPAAGSNKSPKLKNRLAPVISISESVSEFVSNIITIASQGSWLKSESNLVEEYVKLALDGLVSQRLSPKLEAVCGHILEYLSPLLTLRTLSKCLVEFLELPLSHLVGEGSSDERGNAETPCCMAVFQLLKHLKALLKTDPTFVGQQQMVKLFCAGSELHIGSREFLPSGNRLMAGDLTSCTDSDEFEKESTVLLGHSFISNQQLARTSLPFKGKFQTKSEDFVHCQDKHRPNGCVQIKATFRFEDRTGQMVSSLAPVFLLLPHCENKHLLEFVVFALDHIRQTAALIQPVIYDRLFQNPLALVAGSQQQQLFTAFVTHVQGCFLLYEQWLTTHVTAVIKRDKWFLLDTYLQANSNISGGQSAAFETVKQNASSCLRTLDAARLSQSLPCWMLLSVAVDTQDPQFQKLLADTIMSHVKRHESCQQLHFDVLKISSGFCERETQPGGQSSHASVLDQVLDYLTYLIVEGSTDHRDLEEYLVDMASHLVPQLVSSDWTLLLKSWQHLVQETLRHRLTDHKILKLVTSLTEHVLPLGSDVTAPNPLGSPPVAAQHLFEQCVDHPMFQAVMTSGEFTGVKDELVKLLHIAGEINISCYKSSALESVLPSAYTASLSLTDQRLLLMMKRCSQSKGADFECPVLWGKSATEQQSVSEVLGPSLHKQASAQVVLEQLKPALMQESILNFPVRRQCSSDPIVEASEFKGKSSCYDPSFLLRLFRQILSPDKQVPMRLFVEKDCLSYLLIALSSHDQCTRLHAYHALNDFYLHAEGARWHEKTEITFVLDLLTASRVKDGQKLSFVVALFFARTVRLFLHPADPMYLPVFRFLMAKPEVDLSSVPEFYKLFFSAGVQYKQERNWMLALLSDGIRETSDYWLYQKKFIFKIIFTFYDSALSDAHSQELVLRTVKNACKEKSVAVDLVQNHGLMSWLVAAVNCLDRRPEHAGHLCDICWSLWSSLTTTRYVSQADLPARRTLQGIPRPTAVEMGLLVKTLIPHLSKTNRAGLVKIVQVLYGMTQHDTRKTPCEHSTTSTTDQATDSHPQDLLNLSPLEACQLLYHVAAAIQQPAMADAAASILKSKGISFEWKAKQVHRKSSTNVKRSGVKSDDLDVPDVDEEGTVPPAPSSRCVGEAEVKDANAGTDVSTGELTSGQCRALFHMLYDIISATRTVEFI